MANNERVTISLDPEDDRDLLQWLAAQRNRSEAVRRALRYYIKAPRHCTVTMARTMNPRRPWQRWMRLPILRSGGARGRCGHPRAGTGWRRAPPPIPSLV